MIWQDIEPNDPPEELDFITNGHAPLMTAREGPPALALDFDASFSMTPVYLANHCQKPPN